MCRGVRHFPGGSPKSGLALPTQVSSFLSASVNANTSDRGLSSRVKTPGSVLPRPQGCELSAKSKLF